MQHVGFLRGIGLRKVHQVQAAFSQKMHLVIINAFQQQLFLYLAGGVQVRDHKIESSFHDILRDSQDVEH